MLIYPIKEILNPAHPHRRVNIPGDLPGRFCFSADGKYIVVYTQLGKAVLVYSVAPVCKFYSDLGPEIPILMLMG